MIDSLTLAGSDGIWSIKAVVHVVVGAFVLAIIEGSLLAWLWKLPTRAAMRGMVLPNFVAALVSNGAVLLLVLTLIKAIPDGMYIRSMLRIILVGVVAAFVITVLVEWAYVSRLFKRIQPARRGSLLATLLVNFATAPLVLVFYWSSADLSIYTGLRHDHSLAFVPDNLTQGCWVYYLGDDGTTVYRIRLDGGERETVATVPASQSWRDLQLWPREGDVQSSIVRRSVDLWFVGTPRSGSDGVAQQRVAEGVAEWAVLPGYLVEDPTRAVAMPPLRGKFVPTDWRAASDIKWRAEQYGTETIFGADGHDPITLGLFHRWDMGEAAEALRPIMLPGNLVVHAMSFGGSPVRSEIVVLDLDARTAGVLAAGESPVVVFEGPPP